MGPLALEYAGLESSFHLASRSVYGAGRILVGAARDGIALPGSSLVSGLVVVVPTQLAVLFSL